jgi:hypothetical protein
MTAAAGGRRKIEGYAAVFDSRSQMLRAEDDSPFYEFVRPGAFLRSLKDSDVRALYNHDARYLLGRQKAGTLKLGEDSRGLAYEITPGTRSYERDLEESMDRGDVTGSSFSFAPVEDEWADGPEGVAVRSLKCVHLFDVGPVVFPAYRSSTAACRSLAEWREARAVTHEAPPPVVYPTPAQLQLLHLFNIADF